MRRFLGIAICLLFLSGQVIAKGGWFPFKPNNFINHTSASGSSWIRMGELPGAEAVWWLLEAQDGAIYAATTCSDMGRVFKSTDNCETWDTTATLSEEVEEALSIFQSRDGALYVGTIGRDYVGRVFKSIDLGNSWIEAGSFNKAAIFPLIETSDGALYAGAICLDGIGRIFKSQNSGETWTISGEFEEVDGIFSLLSASNGILYAGGGREALEKPPEGLYVYKSTDSGNSWAKAGFLEKAMYIFSLLESKDGTLYASTLSWKPAGAETLPVGKVFRSIDGGDNWEGTQDIPEFWWAWPLIETTDGALYVGGNWGGELGEGGETKIFKSADGGDSWIDTGILEGANMVYSLLQTSDGSIYAGTGDENGDVFKYTPVGIKEEYISNKSPTLITSSNPFSQSTMIKYQGIGEEVNLCIYDATGRLVKSFTKIQIQKSGVYSITWDGRDEKGIEVPPGVYFIQAKTQIGVEVEKILKIR